MDFETDQFYKYLTNRVKNLNKKIEKIDQKRQQSRQPGAKLLDEEVKFIESKPTILTQIQELEGLQK